MDIVKVLKRKDGASLVVGVVVAFVLINLLSNVTARLSSWLAGIDTGQFGVPGGWKAEYLHPVINAIVQLLVLEILIRLYVLVHDAVSGK